MTEHQPECASRLDPRIMIKDGKPAGLMHYCGCHRTRELLDHEKKERVDGYGREKRRQGYAAAIHDAISAVNAITASLVPDPRGPEWINVIPKERAIKAILGCEEPVEPVDDGGVALWFKAHHDAIDREREERDAR